MPTLNPQLKISTTCVRDLSRSRHEDYGERTALTLSDSDYDNHLAGATNSYSNSIVTNTSSISNKGNNTSIESSQYDDYLRRKVQELRIHVNQNVLHRNASDTSVPWTSEENESEITGVESSIKPNKRFSNTSDFIINPSLVPGNLRNTRAKSASQIMQEFLCRGSLEPTQRDSKGKIEGHGISRGDSDFLKVSRIKAKRKPVKLTASKQQINKPKERINSTMPARIPNIHGFQFRNKVNSDISINIPPYLQNSSKDHLSPYQCNSSAPRVKNGKRATNSFEQVVRRKPCHGDEQMKLQKVYLTKIQSSSHDVMSSEQSSCEQDQPSTCERDSVMADIKPQKATRQMHKSEVRVPDRERTSSEEKKQADNSLPMMRFELKRKQRREIYALNKVMTDLENERFVLFMQDVASSAGSI
ncbi:hypothetical protein BsWGS_26481 [Bradybaena similaris]